MRKEKKENEMKKLFLLVGCECISGKERAEYLY